MPALTAKTFTSAVHELASRDADLATVVQRCGPPPFWSRPRGFATLVWIILEQQVSLASAKSTYLKLSALMSRFDEANYLSLTDDELRGAGVSRQKVRYTRIAAEAIVTGDLPLAGLGRRSDEAVRESLTALTGIGNWTADVYMMTALRRADLWPTGDLALVKAVQELKGGGVMADAAALQDVGERYRPLRSVATRLFWHHYLNP